MDWTIPGTVITAPREEANHLQERFGAMFLAGGMMLGQVTSLTGLDAYMIQNWVKRGFLSKPENKRYTLNQLCRILNINMLRGILPMERICGLLAYVNGQLDDESDDIIDDAKLYFIFVRLAARARSLDSQEDWDLALAEVMAQYHEPVPGAARRVERVLRIMLTAWIAGRMAQEAERMINTL